MAVFAIHVDLEGTYFGQTQKWGNTYHYKTNTAEPFRDQEFALQVIDAQRRVTPSDVKFTGWQTWGPTDGPMFDNVMREDGQVNDFGIGTPNAGQYVESCILAIWPMSRSPITNRKRWLRKFLRSGTTNLGLNDATISGKAAITAGGLTDIRDNYIIPVTTLEAATGAVQLCNEDGDEPNDPGFARPYLFTRQIGR